MLIFLNYTFFDDIIDTGEEKDITGSFVIAVGHPEHIIKKKNSYTAQFLQKKLAFRLII